MPYCKKNRMILLLEIKKCWISFFALPQNGCFLALKFDCKDISFHHLANMLKIK